MKKFFEEFKAFALKGQHDGYGHRCYHRRRVLHAGHFLTDNLISPILGILGKGEL